jgi:hypothetical protein
VTKGDTARIRVVPLEAAELDYHFDDTRTAASRMTPIPQPSGVREVALAKSSSNAAAFSPSGGAARMMVEGELGA